MLDASKPPLTGELRPGTRLGRYELLLPIAQGGMARVWAARQHGHRGFSKVVAIKTILPELASDPAFEAMFLDEARLASEVHHPNVCEIFDLGEEDGTLYIAMEWVNGESLSRILKPPVAKGEKPVAIRLNARIAARIVADAAKGLHAAHELQDDTGQPLHVVHRDVSPQNILVALTGTVKVSDFGVAKALRSTQEVTSAGQIKGKFAYMAPEHARGAPVDRRSDVFALGIVLYEITTGKRPFQGTELELLRALQDGRFQPAASVVPDYPPDLEAIVKKAMAMDPNDRFLTADAMRFALEEWVARSGPLVTEVAVSRTARERVGGLVEQRAGKIRERTRAAAPGLSSAPTSSGTPPGVASSIDAARITGTPNASATPPPISNTPEHPSAPAASSVPSVSGVRAPTGSSGGVMADFASVPVGLGSTQPMPVQVAPSLEPAPTFIPPASQTQPDPTPPPPDDRAAEHSVVSTVSHASAPSGVSAQSAVSQVAPMVATTPPPAMHAAEAGSGGNTALIGMVIGAGAFVLLALAGGGYFAIRNRKPPEAPPPATAPVAAAPAPMASVSPLAMGQIRVQLVEPKSGVTLLVDGAKLPDGTLSFERPKPGGVKLVTATADGYKEEVFRVDDGADDVLDVLLQRAGAPATAEASREQRNERPAEKREPSDKSESKSEKDKKSKSSKPDIPDNPF